MLEHQKCINLHLRNNKCNWGKLEIQIQDHLILQQVESNFVLATTVVFLSSLLSVVVLTFVSWKRKDENTSSLLFKTFLWWEWLATITPALWQSSSSGPRVLWWGWLLVVGAAKSGLSSPVYYYELGVKQQIVSDSVGASAVVTLYPWPIRGQYFTVMTNQRRSFCLLYCRAPGTGHSSE